MPSSRQLSSPDLMTLPGARKGEALASLEQVAKITSAGSIIATYLYPQRCHQG